MALKILVAAAVLLGGCAAKSMPVQPVSVVYRDTLAGVPLPVAPRALPSPPPSQDARVLLDVVMGQWCKAAAYITEAAPLLARGAGLPPPSLPDYLECAPR